ncbi:MAG: hypothetical protein WC832_10520 [Anaerolineales bacterium]
MLSSRFIRWSLGPILLMMGPTDKQINGKVIVNDPSRRRELNP